MSCYFHILFDNLSEYTSKTIEKLGKVFLGSTPSKSKNKYWCKNGIPWIKVEDIQNKFINGGEEDITEEGYRSCSTKLLPINSILFSSGGTIGKIAITNKELCTNQSILALVQNDKDPLFFHYFLLKENIHKILNSSNGTAQLGLPKGVFQNISLPYFPKELIQKFNEICKSIFELQKVNEQEIRELINLQKMLVEKLN